MPHETPTTSHSTRRLRHRGLLALVYLSALLGLIVWEYRERLVEFTSACELESPSPRSELYAAPYRRMLAWATSESSSHVAVVAIPEDLENIQGNLCLARGYVADLLQVVAQQHPAEVVLDKFYGPSTCPVKDASANALPETIRSLPFPVVVGESTNKAESETDQACLIYKPQLDFHAPNVRYGITRMTIEPERIPLVWRVLPKEDKDAKAGLRDSLSWAAVQAYDPQYAKERLAALAEAEGEPYAKIQVKLPRTTSTALLCKAGTPEMRERWGLECGAGAEVPSLLGKVVVIGSEQESDRRTALGAPIWGFDLQARYIEDLLSGNYLRAVPVGWDFALFAGFIFFIEGLPTAMKALRPHWNAHWFFGPAFHHRNYRWVFLGAIGFIVGTTILALVSGFLPPLLVFGDIALVTITRLLLFTAGSIEIPLVHPQSHPHGGHMESGGRVHPSHKAQHNDHGNENVKEAIMFENNKPGDEAGTPGEQQTPPPPPPPPPPPGWDQEPPDGPDETPDDAPPDPEAPGEFPPPPPPPPPPIPDNKPGDEAGTPGLS